MKTVFLIAGIITLFFVFGCSQSSEQQAVQEPEDSAPLQDDKTAKAVSYPAEQQETVSEEKKPSAEDCKDIQSTFEKDNCLSRVAVQALDSFACTQISQDSIQGDCFEAVAIASKSKSVCSLNSSETFLNSCFKNYALELSDETACEYATEQSLIDDCLALVAIKKHDRTICERIKIERFKEKCLEQA